MAAARRATSAAIEKIAEVPVEQEPALQVLAGEITQSLEPQKTTAVIIDGASLFNMGRLMGISVLNYRELYKILTELSNFPLMDKPRVTVTGKFDEELERRAVAWEKNGFAVIPVKPVKGMKSPDDAAIIEMIDDLPDEVGELILLAADQDFFEVLERAHGRGIATKVLAADVASQPGSSPMVARILAYTDWVQFYNLAEYRERLILKEWVNKPTNGHEYFTPKTMRRYRRLCVTMIVPEDINFVTWNNILNKAAGLLGASDTEGQMNIEYIQWEEW